MKTERLHGEGDTIGQHGGRERETIGQHGEGESIGEHGEGESIGQQERDRVSVNMERERASVNMEKERASVNMKKDRVSVNRRGRDYRYVRRYILIFRNFFIKSVKPALLAVVQQYSSMPEPVQVEDVDHVPVEEDHDEDAEYEKALDEEEAMETKEEIDQELADLKDEAEMTVEQLRAKYYGGESASNGTTSKGTKRKSQEELGDQQRKPPPKKAKADVVYTMNVNGAIDKAHRGKSLKEIIALPPSALKGLGSRVDPMFKAFRIDSIEKLGSWKHYVNAKAITVLASLEEEGKRHPESKLNINKALDKAYETKTLSEVCKSPISCLQGLAEWTDTVLKDLYLHKVSDLAKWKFCMWAESLVSLAKFESPDMSS
ncbi:hypothetical protein AAMO2058_001080400 [Amorphochlora amoebiformis]